MFMSPTRILHLLAALRLASARLARDDDNLVAATVLHVVECVVRQREDVGLQFGVKR